MGCSSLRKFCRKLLSHGTNVGPPHFLLTAILARVFDNRQSAHLGSYRSTVRAVGVLFVRPPVLFFSGMV